MFSKIQPNLLVLFNNLKSISRRNKMVDAIKTYTLYGDDISPPVRFVKMTAAVLGVSYQMQKVDLFKGENKTKQYTQINPLQKVPAMTIGDETLLDSHVIALHLCETFDNDNLYPKDPIVRARVLQILFFNCSNLFPIDSDIFTAYFSGQKVDEEKRIHWDKSLDFLEYQLQKYSWLADKKMRLGDLCCGATVSSLQLLIPLTEKHPKVNDWLNRLQKVDFFKENSAGLQTLKFYVDQFKEKKAE